VVGEMKLEERKQQREREREERAGGEKDKVVKRVKSGEGQCCCCCMGFPEWFPDLAACVGDCGRTAVGCEDRGGSYRDYDNKLSSLRSTNVF
jgi:hypothetical protein